MTDTQRPQRPPRSAPLRPGVEADADASDDLDLPPARKRPAPRKPSVAKTTATTKRLPRKPAPKRAASRTQAATSSKPRPKRAPSAAQRRRPAATSEVEYSYGDDEKQRRQEVAAKAKVAEGVVRPGGDIHLPLADEAWWIMPEVCAKTGEPATKTITYAPTGAPKWAYLSFLLGVIPGYVILRTAFKSARVQLPFSSKVRRRRSLWMVAFMFGIALGVPAVVGGAATGADGTGVLVFGLVFTALAVLAIVRMRTRVKVRIVGDDVVISGAHPAFAAALSMLPTADEQRAVFENTSGAGKATVVPKQVKRWNWGAFFLTPIWAIGNSVWIGLLGFVPFVNLVMSFVLGAKGNEWAWRKKRWPSVENFLQTQRTWGVASAAILVGTVVLGIVYSIAGYEAPPAAPSGYGTTNTAVADYASGEGGVKAGVAYGFTATFPGTPSHDELTEDAGEFELPIDLLTNESDDAAFQVGVVTYPDAVDLSNPRGLLRAAAEGSASAIEDGKLLRFAETTVGADPAAGALISGANGVFARQRYVLHGHQLFTIQVVSMSQNPPGFGRFVDSFRVLTAIDIDAPAA